MVKRLPARGVLLFLLLISIGARAQTTPRETYDYGQPTNCGSACNAGTLTSGLRVPAVPNGTAGSTVTIPSNAFVYPFGSYNFTGGNTQATCTLTDAATITWSATTCASNAAKGTGFQFVQLGGNRTLGCGTGITAGNDGQVVVFYIQQPGSGGPYTLTPTTSCQWTVNSLNGSNTFNLGPIANEIDELITHTIYYSGSTYLVVDNLIPNINAAGGCSQAVTFLARTSGENTAALTAFICGMVTDGLIDSSASMASTGSNTYCGSGSVFDRLFIHAMANSTDGLLDVCGHSSATLNNSPTFTANNGFTGTTNSSIWIDSGYNMSSGAVVASLNNAHMSMWSLTDMSNNANQAIGNSGGGSGTALVIEARYSDGNTYIKVNDGTYLATTSTPRSDGWLLAQRTGASARAYYRAGASQSSDTQASTSIPNASLLNLNVGGTPFGWPGTSAMFSAGKSLTSGQITSFNARGCTYLTAVLGAKPSYCP